MSTNTNTTTTTTTTNSNETATCSACKKTGENLKKCTACKSVQYCDKECQINGWRSGHKSKCKHMKYTREIEEALETLEVTEMVPEKECPICMNNLPPAEVGGCSYAACCGKVICESCSQKTMMAQMSNGYIPGANLPCAYCRQVIDVSQGADQLLGHLKRQIIDNGDTRAMVMLGIHFWYTQPNRIVLPNPPLALKIFAKAAKAGKHPMAAINAGLILEDAFTLNEKSAKEYGTVPIPRDVDEAMQYYQLCIDHGCPAQGHFQLAELELDRHNDAEAKQHYMAAAAQGHEESLAKLEQHGHKLKDGNAITAAELAETKAGYQAARERLDN